MFVNSRIDNAYLSTKHKIIYICKSEYKYKYKYFINISILIEKVQHFFLLFKLFLYLN